MYQPAGRFAWVRYVLYAAAAILIVLFALFYRVPLRPRVRPVYWQPHPSSGRVTIPNIPRDSDARVDDEVVAVADARPATPSHGCYRLRGAGNDAGTTDRVECRFPAEHTHLFELRHPGREPDIWRIFIPREEHEAVLVP